MPYVKRAADGRIEAVSQQRGAGCDEWLEVDSTELTHFAQSISDGQAKLAETDQAFVRVTEDLVELLINKNLICFTDLPPMAQQKILQRQQLRSQLENRLDLLQEDSEPDLML